VGRNQWKNVCIYASCRAYTGGVDAVSIVAALLAGVLAGAGVVWFALRSQLGESKGQCGKLSADLESARAELSASQQAKAAAEARLLELEELKTTLQGKENQLDGVRTENAHLQSRIAALENEVESRKAALEEARQQLKTEFEAAASRVLNGQREAFLQEAKEKLEGITKLSQSDLEKRQQAIDALIKPINDQLGKVELHIAEMEKSRVGAYEGLSEQVKSLVETQLRLDSQAKNLVQALKSTNVRGRWGEIQLQNLVEMAGMLNYCDFMVQESVSTEDGKLRPDLVVRMPNQHQIIVDSKAPIGSYLEGHEEEDEAARAIHFQKFSNHVRSHIQALSSKAYWDQFKSAEFVVMFLPGEPFLGAALRYDPELIEFSFKHKVILATPTTLLALLKTVAYGWRQETIAKEAHRIAEEGKKLHANIADYMKHFSTIGAALEKATSAYQAAEKNMAGRMLNSAKKLETLGAKSAKTLSASAAVLAEDFEELEQRADAAPELPGVNRAEETVEGLFDEPV
jgi:DNA recombination protein RmuC